MKNGFTLIELLAVIVILAIIALIATPIVLSIIDDSKESAMVRSAEGYLRAVEYEVARAYVTANRITEGTYYVLSTGDICIDGYENNTCSGNIFEIEYNNEGPISGSITFEDTKIVHYTFTYPSGITVVDGRVGELEKVCKLTLDEDSDGIADTGDMITCSTESFYVISNDGISISMFSEKNIRLSLTNPGQSDDATTTKFSTTDYWYDWNIKNYIVDSNYSVEGRKYPFIYGNYKGEDGNQYNLIYQYIKVYEQYLIETGVKSAKTTLISYDQLEKLGCNKDAFTCTLSKYDWVYKTRYWSGSAYSDGTVWFVSAGGSFGYDYYYSDTYGGIRTVINISVNEL